MEVLTGTGTGTGTALTAPWPTDLKVVFGKPDGAAAIIARVKADAMEQVKGLTVATKRDRDAIASAAYAVAKRKTALDNAGKALNDELRVSINAVDAERRQIRESLDAIKDDVRKPLDEWEAAEEARVAAIKARVERLRLAHETLHHGFMAADASALLARVEVVAIDDTWGEFTVDAARYKDQAIVTIRTMRDAAEQRAADEARAKREADQAHRAKIKAAISGALAAMAGAATPDAIADALMAGKIPHVQVML